MRRRTFRSILLTSNSRTHCGFVYVCAEEIDTSKAGLVQVRFLIFFPTQHVSQLVKMRSEEGSALVCVMKFVESCKRNRETDRRSGPSTDLVADHQRSRGSSSQDLTSLLHFDHCVENRKNRRSVSDIKVAV